MSAKDTAKDAACLGLLEKLQPFLPYDKILEGANNFQKPLKLLASIDGLGKAAKFFKSIQSYVEQSILKPLSDCQDKFIILIDEDDTFSETNVLYIFCALAYGKGDSACLKEIADQYQHHDGVGHVMIFLGVIFSERMEYKRSETCFVSAKSCFEHEHDHLKNAVATLNLAILYKLFGDYQSAVSCCDAAASLCHDVSMRATNDVDLPWKLLMRVAGLCQEFGNYKRCQDILQIGVFCEIGGASEASQVNSAKQLMTLQLKEQNGEKIKGEELEEFASCLFVLMGQSSTENLPKPELINADFIMMVITVAKMYRDIDHLEEACKLLEKLETTLLLVHGRKHSLYGSLLYQTGSFKLGAGNAAEAFKTLQQAQAIFVRNFGQGHHMVAWCKSLLGTCALVKGHPRGASMFLNEALVLFKKMNHHHPEVAEILLKLALLSSEDENFQSAKTTVQEAVDIFISACGEVSPKTGSAYFQAAAILQKAGESRAAVDKVRKAIDIFLQLGLRCDHPDVKTCRSLLGVFLVSLGQTEEAEEQFTEVQQQVPLQDEPCLTAKVIAPENTNMFFQAKTDCGTGRYMDSCFGAQVVSLVNLVRMKIGEERRNHLNTLLSCLQGHETEEPQIIDFAGQTVYFNSHKVRIPDRYVYYILASTPSPDCFQTGQGQNSDYASWKSDSSQDPNVFLLSSSNSHGKKPCSVVFWKTSKVLELKELSCIGSAFRESVNMLFLQPKFRKGYLEGQDFYTELTLPNDLCASFSLSAQIDHLPLLVELELSNPHKESANSVVHTSLISAVEPSTHVSYFSYRFSSQRQAELVFGSLIFSLGQSLALKVEADEIMNASAVEDGAFFLFLEPNNSSLSVVVEKESVVVKCRTVKDFDSACICSLVKNTLDSTMESLCHVVKVKFEASVQLPCGDYLKESANCSCGCRDSQRESTCSSHSLETLDSHAHVRSQESESDHLEGKPSADVLHNESEEDILFSGHPVEKSSTDVCVNLLECLLSNRHEPSEVHQSDTSEMLSTEPPCLDESIKCSLLSPGSTSSLNSLPTSPSNEMPVFSQNMSLSFLKGTAEPFDEKDDFNADHLSEKSPMACAGCRESPLSLQEKVPNSSVGDNLLQDCSAMRSSYEEGLPSGESGNDAGTTDTMQLKDGTGLSEEEIWILKSEVEFSHNQCYELRKQIVELKEQLQQFEAEKQQLELELGSRTFFEDKQKRSKKFLLSTRAHVSEPNTSCTASGASYAFMEGKLLGGASPLHELGFSLHGKLLEISNSLSEVELEQIKLLVRPKVDAFRLKKIREGFKLFEELEARGELSLTFVKELLEGIQRFDLLQKLDVPLPNSSGTGRPSDQRMLHRIQCKESPDEDCSLSPALVVIPSEEKTLDVFSKRHDSAANEPSDGMHLQGDDENDMESEGNEADSGCSGNSENSGGDKAVLSLNADCDDSSAESDSDAKERTRVLDSFNGGFPSNENSSIAVSSSELSASSDMIAQSFSDDSTFPSCTSQDVCERSPRATPDLPSDVRNRDTTGDSSFSPTNREDEILESSLLPNDTYECERKSMDTTETGAAQGGRNDEISETSGGVCGGPMKPPHLEARCSAGVGKDVVDSGPLHGPNRVRSRPNSVHMPGPMKDALPDGDISVGQNWSGAHSGVRKDSTEDHSSSLVYTQSNEWERLGARPRDRPSVKTAPLAPSLASLVDLVPQEVAGPVAHGVANAFLARHSQDKGLHESLNQGSVSKDTSLQGASYVDGMMSLSERNKAKPYFGECQADVHSRLQFPIPSLPEGGFDSRNTVSGYPYNGQTGLGTGPSPSYFTGSNCLVNGNFPSGSAFNSSIYNSSTSNFPLGTSRPSGIGHFDREPHLPFNGQVGSDFYTSLPMSPRFHPGMTGSYFGNGTLMGAAEPPLPPPVAGAQGYMASERVKTQTALTANARLGNQSSITANSDYLPSASTGNIARVNAQLGSAGLPPPTVTRSDGADAIHQSEAESSRTSQYGLDTLRSNMLDTSGDQSVAGVNRDTYNGHIEAGLPSNDSILSQLVAGANADGNREPQGAGSSLLSSNTGGSMLNRDFGTDSVESTDNSLLALEQRVEEACALVERVLREREEREEFGREIERKEREIREQRARKRREREARELEEASRWPQEQEAITGRSQWLCEHYQRHCRVRFPCCSHFYSCHRCHNNSKACDNEEAKASHATHLKCSFCQHEQEIGEDSGKCRSCGAQMSAYFCAICKHFTSVDKNPYHCKKCGICRIHKDKSFHCEVCNVCLDKRLEGKHKCRPDSGHDECCICLEDAFSGCQILPCSHKVHRECAIAMIQNGIRTCPVCRHPLYSPAPE